MENMENLLSKFATNVRSLSALIGQEVRVSTSTNTDPEHGLFYTVLVQTSNATKAYHFPDGAFELVEKTSMSKVLADLTYPNLLRAYPNLDKIINKLSYQQQVEKVLNPPKAKNGKKKEE